MKKTTSIIVLVMAFVSGLAALDIVVAPGGPLWVGTNVQLGLSEVPSPGSGVTATWILGDTSPPVTGMVAEHVYKDPGAYEVRCTLSNGIAATRRLEIQERRTIQAQPASPLAGEEVRFQAQHFGHSQIRWDFGDGTVQNASSPVMHVFSNPGTVTVKAYDFNGQSSVAVETTLTISMDMRSILTTGGPPKAGLPLQFTAERFGSGSLRWDFGDGTVENGGTSMQHTYLNAGNFQVSVQVAGSATATPKTLMLSVAPDPRRVSADVSSPGLYETVTLRAEGFAPGNLDWNFGDGNSQTAGNQVSHAYANLGQFQVTVKPAGSTDPPVAIQLQVNQDRRRLQLQPAQVKVGDQVSIQALNVAAGQVEWQIGNHTESNRPTTITHRFLDPGNVSIACRINGQSPLLTQVQVREHRRIRYFPETVFSGAEVSLQLENGIGPGVRWEFSDGQSRNEGLTARRAFARPGAYEIKAFDANGGSSIPVSQKIHVLVDDRVLVSRYARHFAGQEVQLEARNFKDRSVEWDFGDGTRTIAPLQVAHNFRNPGTYRVKAVDFRGRDGKAIETVLDVSADPRRLELPSRVRAGEPVVLELTGAQSGQFQWNLGPAGRASGVRLQRVVFPVPGRVEIQVEDTSKTYPPYTAAVVVQPDNRAVKAPKFALPQQEVEVEAAGFDGPQVSWDFGDGKPAITAGTRVRHAYAASGKYRITARDNGGSSAKSFTHTVSVVELLPGFSLQGIELVFSSGKAYMVVPRKSRPPSYSLRLVSSGRGVLRGKWILDDQVMGMFSIVIEDGRVATPLQAELPKLPVLDVGMHVLRLELTNYQFSRIPRLRYFVSSGGAILLLNPEIGTRIAAAEAVRLAWKPIRPATVYEIAVSEVPFQFLEDRQIEWLQTSADDHHTLDMRPFRQAGWVYWMVRGLNDSGRVLTTSEIGSFRMK